MTPEALLNQLKPLRTPCPPMLFALMGYEGNARFLAIYYAATDARWTDGRADSPWSFWVYSPLIDHPAIAVNFLFQTTKTTMPSFTTTDKAIIVFALRFFHSNLDEEVLETFCDSHLTDELSERFESKESADRLECFETQIENLHSRLYQPD